MNENIIKNLSEDLNITTKQVILFHLLQDIEKKLLMD